MKTRTERAKDRTTKNEWGGEDYRGTAGLARTSVEDGETTVLYFVLHGKGELLSWKATFSSGTPAEVTQAAIDASRRLADGRPENK